MPSERALLIKQRQQEALRRQQQEIEERDAIRKEKELGIKASQPIQPITTPETIHDLFNSRYKPKTQQPPQQTSNKAEDARLKAYEQKRARFLAKKRARMQPQANVQQPQTHNMSPNPYATPQIQSSPAQSLPFAQTQPQIYNDVQPINIPIQSSTFNKPHDSNPPQDEHRIYSQEHISHAMQHNVIPSEKTTEHMQQNVYKEPEMYRNELLQQMNEQQIQKNMNQEPISHQNDFFPSSTDPKEQRRSKQEQYRNELSQQMKEHESKSANHMYTNQNNKDFFPSTTDPKEQKRSKQEQYRNELSQQMKMKEHESKSVSHKRTNHQTNNDFFPSATYPKEQKRTKQEQYRNELMLQMKQREIQKQDVNKPAHNDTFLGSLSPGIDPQKKMKQEQYRMELLQQMQMKEHGSKSANYTHAKQQQNNAYFGQTVSPYKHPTDYKLQKKERQEKYRQELMEQMRQKQVKQVHDTYHHRTDDAKETELTEEHMPPKYDYAKELEEQMKLKQLNKMAEKERQLLEDRKMLRGGGFLNGFGSNSKQTTHSLLQQNINSAENKNQHHKLLYRMELDKQCREAQEKKMREKQLKDREEMRLEAKIKHDRQQLMKEKYKEDLDKQMKILQEKQQGNMSMNYEKEMQLETKIANDREHDKSMGLFGRDSNREKREKARKQEQYQLELKKQADERKRIKQEKEQMELEKEKRLEMKIQRELKELEMRYKREKQQEINVGAAAASKPAPSKIDVSNVPNVELFVPNKPPVAHVQNVPQIMNVSHISHVPNTTHAAHVSVPPNIIHTPTIHIPAQINHDLFRNDVSSTRHSLLERVPHQEVHNDRPSTSKRMLSELLNLKQDLLENQKMIREELAMHKQQINQQLATASNQNDRKTIEQNSSKAFQKELDQYHNKISTEIGSLRKAILEQQKLKPKKIKKKQIMAPTQVLKQELKLLDMNQHVDSQFIPCTVPQTPLLPQTADTTFTTASTYASSHANETRLNSGFTEFADDEYLLNESKKHNEYLHSANSTRLHTPNIYTVNSAQKGGINGTNICEKSIQSKSDFLYNVMLKQDEEEMELNEEPLTDIAEVIDDDQSNKRSTIHSLLQKNKNRLQYFRSSTPLNSTRSLKIGLQKIEDLLSETDKMNRSKFNIKKPHDLSIDYDDSLYELL